MLALIVQQTNSTAATTILQQTSGLSSAEWVTAISSAIMMGATVVLAYYAYLTIDEGKKDRTRNSIEKQLENLYTPMFETMEACQKFKDPSLEISPEDKASFVHLNENELAILRSAFAKYGHYLDDTSHDMMKEFLDPKWGGEGTGKYHRFPRDGLTAHSFVLGESKEDYHFLEICFDDCMKMIRANRDGLRKELRKLTSEKQSYYTYDRPRSTLDGIRLAMDKKENK